MMMMKSIISRKKMMEIMGRKWEKQGMIMKRNNESKVKAEKGHFVVYSSDERRFVIPLVYLKNKIIREMLKLAEDEFGLSSNVPLTLPFEATFIDYVLMLIDRNVTKHLQDQLLISISSSSSSCEQLRQYTF